MGRLGLLTLWVGQQQEEAEQEGRASDHHALAVVCVDGSPEGDAALDFALDHLQRARSLVLVHGIHVPLTSSSRPGPLFGEDERTDQEHRALERRYLQRCHDANVRGRDTSLVCVCVCVCCGWVQC